MLGNFCFCWMKMLDALLLENKKLKIRPGMSKNTSILNFCSFDFWSVLQRQLQPIKERIMVLSNWKFKYTIQKKNNSIEKICNEKLLQENVTIISISLNSKRLSRKQIDKDFKKEPKPPSKRHWITMKKRIRSWSKTLNGRITTAHLQQ